MIRVFYLQNTGSLTWSKNPDPLIPADCERMVWVDMQSPTDDERKLVEKTFQIELSTEQEAAEIERSSRYFKKRNPLYIQECRYQIFCRDGQETKSLQQYQFSQRHTNISITTGNTD